MTHRLVSLLPIVFLFGWIVGTYKDWPVSWDEPDLLHYGELIRRYYLSGGADSSVFGFSNLYLYGGWMPLCLHTFAKLLENSLGYYESAHLFNAAIGSIALLSVWLLAVLISGYRAAFFTTLILATTPTYLGSIFNNFKDVPFAAFYALSVYYVLKVTSLPSHTRARDAIAMGISFGLTMGVRSGGLMLWVILLVACLIRSRGLRVSEGKSILGSESVRWRIYLYGSLMISYGVMILFWPWGQLNITSNPLLSFSMLSKLQWMGATLFEGRYHLSGSLPNYYLPKIFALTSPTSVLVGLTLFAFVFARMLILKEYQRISDVLIILFAILFPVLAAIYGGAVLYDGMRHFLFIVPLVAVLVGLGFSGLIELSMRPWSRRGLDIAAFLVCTMHLPYVYSLHPFEYSYYNREFAGGIEGVWGRYELDYWGYALRENVNCLEQVAASTDRQLSYRLAYGDPEQVTVYSEGEAKRLTYWVIENKEPAEFRLMGVRWRCPEDGQWRSLAAVARRGIPLSILQVRHDSTAPPSETVTGCGTSWLSGEALSQKLKQLPILPSEPQICD